MCLMLIFYAVLVPLIWALSLYLTRGHISSFLLTSGLQGYKSGLFMEMPWQFIKVYYKVMSNVENRFTNFSIRFNFCCNSHASSKCS
jgi:hypothetical protein